MLVTSFNRSVMLSVFDHFDLCDIGIFRSSDFLGNPIFVVGDELLRVFDDVSWRAIINLQLIVYEINVEVNDSDARCTLVLPLAIQKLLGRRRQR